MSRRESGNLQHQAEHTRARRRTPVMGYLVILFAVAFLLLLLAYFQQQRSNTEATDALKQSVSAVQSIQLLMEENESLKSQVEQLEQELSDAQELAERSEAYAAGQEAAVKAMDYFWQIDEAYVRQRYSLCRQLIQELKESGCEGALPSTKATENDRFSPRARYDEIYQALY